ncbi:hypothetical protein BC835DRAFT_691448 [Cytidiella melzeri]|nr:hypothetical protein BC835DRAFT_691448 [Cytidiella melzeri]
MCVDLQNNGTALQALCCAGILNDPAQCAICPNTDLAGIGVRVAFYMQSIVNALLIAFSPSDSVPTAWAGTLLTLALVIAGFVSKQQQNLTLHHATLVLNFVTLSTISSLAVAPMLPIWRLSPAEYYERHRRRHALLYTDVDDSRYLQSPFVFEGSLYANTQKQRVKAAQRRQREVLSIVLLLQVVLQWAWGLFLFVDPRYSQPELSDSTILVLFMIPFDTGSMNDADTHTAGFLIWAAWILFCLAVTMWLVANLAAAGSAHSQSLLSSVNSGTGMTSGTPIGRQWESLIRETLLLKITMKQAKIGLKAFVFVALWVVFVVASEWQRSLNCIFPAEENFGGLGQVKTS